MSDTYPPLSQPPYGAEGTYPSTPSESTINESSNSGSTRQAGDVKDQAAHIADGAADAAKDVAGSAKEQAAHVASEAKSQARNLFETTRSELHEQAGVQQQRVASGLHSISDELGGMASNSDNHGLAADLVRQASDRTKGIASWLDDRDPGSLLDEVRSFARERPGTFIAIAAVAGVLAGRLARSVGANSSNSSSTESSASRAGAHTQSPADSTRSTYFTETTATRESDTFGLGAARIANPEQSDIGAYPTDADFGADLVDSDFVETTYRQPVGYVDDTARFEEPRQ